MDKGQTQYDRTATQNVVPLDCNKLGTIIDSEPAFGAFVSWLTNGYTRLNSGVKPAMEGRVSDLHIHIETGSGGSPTFTVTSGVGAARNT